MITIPVNLSAGRYEIVVQPQSLAQVGQRLKQLLPCTSAAVITDSNVAPHHLPVIDKSLHDVRVQPICITIPAGEKNKNFHQLELIFDQLIDARAERGTPILALGGGVVGDVAGLAAAIYLRGVPFVQVPTSLLAMVDASIGGKTAVNLGRGKNLVGAFHQPRVVWIDPALLRTLPRDELRNGLAECIKHALIRDAALFARMEKHLDRALRFDIDYLAELISHNAAIKARIVEADPFEHGERAHLNFGHTFGHAIEIVSRYTYSHGQSVALGMIAAARTARAMNLLDAPSVSRIEIAIAAAGLPTGRMPLDPQQVLHAMSFDKKVRDGRLRLILLDRIGHAVIRDDVPLAIVGEAVASLRS